MKQNTNDLSLRQNMKDDDDYVSDYQTNNDQDQNQIDYNSGFNDDFRKLRKSTKQSDDGGLKQKNSNIIDLNKPYQKVLYKIDRGFIFK